MNIKFPKKILGDFNGKKVVFRTRNPVYSLYTILLTIALASLLLIIIWYSDDFAFSFAISSASVLAATYACMITLLLRTEDKANTYCLMIEHIKLHNDRIIFQIKNIGSANVSEATISELRINDSFIINNIKINFIPVNGRIHFSHVSGAKWHSIKKMSYKIFCSVGDNSCVLLNYEQKMKPFRGKYFIKDNTCELTRKRYYKWWF